MKKIAKILALVLVCVMLVGVLAACDKTPSSTPGNASTPNSSQGQGSSSGNNQGGNNQPQGDPYEVVVKYCYWWEQPTDEGTIGVEDAITDYMHELGYNYSLKIEWASLFEYDTQVEMALAAGEKMDIIFGNRNMPTKVANGYLVDMNPYLDNELAEAVEIIGDWLICGQVDGGTYTLPVMNTNVVTYCYDYLTKYVDPVGYDLSKVEGWYDFEEFFAALKAEWPELRMDVDGSRYVSIIADLAHTTTIGTYGATVGDDTTVVNRFETAAWLEAIETTYRFRTLGYTNPAGSEDSAKNSEGPIDEVQIGIIIGYTSSPDRHASMYTDRTGLDCGALYVSAANRQTIASGWGLAYTSENLSAAATVLNLMWADEFVYNTMMFGLEGRDYVITEEGYMEYPEGLDEDTVSYQMMLNSGVFANPQLMFQRDATAVENAAYNEELLAKTWASPLLGFTASSGELETAAAAVSNVYNQYYNTLAYGDLEPEATNAMFLDAMKTAGLDSLIAEYNAQAQKWVADNK